MEIPQVAAACKELGDSAGEVYAPPITFGTAPPARPAGADSRGLPCAVGRAPPVGRPVRKVWGVPRRAPSCHCRSAVHVCKLGLFKADPSSEGAALT